MEITHTKIYDNPNYDVLSFQTPKLPFNSDHHVEEQKNQCRRKGNHDNF